MNPLLNLRKILNPQSVSETGKVLTSTSPITVATKNGIKTVSSAISVNSGDTVLIIGGAIHSIVLDQKDLPTYFL